MGNAGNKLSDGRHFFGMDQLRLKHGGVGDIGHHYDNAGNASLLIAHRAEVDGELTDAAIATHHRQIEIVDLMAGNRGVQSIRQNGAASGRNEVRERATDKLALLVAGIVPATVGIADEASGVDYENQALRIIEDLLREVAGAL